MSPFIPFKFDPYNVAEKNKLRIDCYVSTTPLSLAYQTYTLSLASPQSSASSAITLSASDALSLANAMGTTGLWSVSGDNITAKTTIAQSSINTDTGVVTLSNATTAAQTNAVTFTSSTKSFTQDGKWLNLNDGTTYRLGKGSLEESSIQYRKDEITNAFVEGSFVLNALRQNTVETLVVYVIGETTADLQYNVNTLTSAVSQANFWVKVIVEDASYVWRCYAADYVISTPLEFIHARRATVKINIPRDPNEIDGEVV